jgi:hypothetical protein
VKEISGSLVNLVISDFEATALDYAVRQHAGGQYWLAENPLS